MSSEDNIFSYLKNFQIWHSVVLEINPAHSIPQTLTVERVLTATVMNRSPCLIRVAAEVLLYSSGSVFQPMMVGTTGRTVCLIDLGDLT